MENTWVCYRVTLHFSLFSMRYCREKNFSKWMEGGKFSVRSQHRIPSAVSQNNWITFVPNFINKQRVSYHATGCSVIICVCFLEIWWSQNTPIAKKRQKITVGKSHINSIYFGILHTEIILQTHYYSTKFSTLYVTLIHVRTTPINTTPQKWMLNFLY